MFRTLAALLLVLPGLRAQETLTPEGLLALQRIGEPALSPDGRHLLFTVRTVDLAANRTPARVFLLDLATSGALAVDLGEGSEPCWSPDGRRFAIHRGDAIRIVPVQGGDAVEVPIAGGFANLQWAPAGTRFSFTRQVQVGPSPRDRHPDLPLAEARVYDGLMVRHWDHWLDGSHSHLFTLDVDGGGPPVDLMAGEPFDTPLVPFGGKEQIAWSPDGEHLCYTCKRVADPARSTDSALWLVSAAGGTAELLTDGMPGFDQDPVFSPDGRFIAFCSMARGGFESDRVRLMLHDRKNGSNEELLPDLDASVHELRWTRDGRSLFFTVEIEGTTQLFRCGLAERKAVQVTRGRHQLSAPQVAPDGRTVYALRATMERPAELVRIDAANGAITALTDVNGGPFARLRLPSVEAEWFPASDGKRIHAWIVKPPDFDPERRYPLVIYCQGGPQSMIGQGFSFRWNFHLMAAQGYVVAAVNRRGLPGFGQAWNDQISRDWGGQAMRDLLAVTDAMQARSYIDRRRSAAVGASFGGYTVYWLMGNAGDRFACMIAHCGVFNLESMYLSTEELWFVDWDLGGPYWRSPEIAEDYRRFSPHRYVQNWKTPLLVIHGERDYRVPYDQGLQAFTAAQVQGVPSRLLVFPGEGHWIGRPQNAVLWQREFFAWLRRFCG